MTKCGKCNKCNKGKSPNHEKGNNEHCKTECDAKVDLKVDVCPEVSHTQRREKQTKFEVALDFKTTPRCCIREKSHQKTDRCHHTCVFCVDVDLGLECRSRVTKPCSPTATFDLNVDIETDTHCKLEGGCPDKHSA